MKLVHTPSEPIQRDHTDRPDGSGAPAEAEEVHAAVHPYTVFNFYAQTISLNKLNYFGLGNDTPLAGHRCSA